MPSALLSNFFLQMGKLRCRERQLVVEKRLEPRSPNSQDNSNMMQRKEVLEPESLDFVSLLCQC